MNDEVSQDAVQSQDAQPELNTADRNPDALRVEELNTLLKRVQDEVKEDSAEIQG